MHRKVCFIVLVLALFSAAPAQSALKKYAVRSHIVAHFATLSPKVDISGGPEESGTGVVLIDESGANPVLAKLISSINNGGNTFIVPQISGGFIWVNSLSRQGPSSNQTGTGSSASTIDWGNLTGWTLTGSNFCHSIPSLVCTLAGVNDNETTDPAFISTNYDYGSWVFHSTGFTHPGGYVTFTNTSGALGNSVSHHRGSLRADGTVPAVPLLGMGAIVLAIAGMGVTAMRRRND